MPHARAVEDDEVSFFDEELSGFLCECLRDAASRQRFFGPRECGSRPCGLCGGQQPAVLA